MSQLKYNMREGVNQSHEKAKKNLSAKPIKKTFSLRFYDVYLNHYYYYTEVFKDTHK